MYDNRVLVIDDLRSLRETSAHESATYARTTSQGIEQLEKGGWDFVCLDHDLGYDPNEGFMEIWPCIEYIEKNAGGFGDTSFMVITSNPWGAQRMVAALKNAGLHAYSLDWTEKDRLFVGGF